MSHNEQQIQYWNEQAGPRWVALQERLDEELDPIGRAAMDHIGVEAGARVLDVGCGCGSSTLELARRVGPGGRVVGMDVSAPMLARASERREHAGLANVTFERADVQVSPLPASDLMFSRFGVMFFDDPIAAFANVRRALAPAGRLGFVCWRAHDDNPLMNISTRAAAKHLELPPPGSPEQPGPFAFADPERPRRILAGAGFASVRVEPLDVPVLIRHELDDAVKYFLQMGPGAALLRAADPAVVAPVAATLRELLEPYSTPEGIAMNAAVWVATASG